MEIKEKIYIVILLFLVADFLIIFFVLNPLHQDIKDVSDRFLERKKEIVELETRLKELKSLKNTYAKIEPDSRKVETLFVNPDKPIRFITFLEEAADESELTINISPGSGAKFKNEKWNPVIFKIETSGTFPSLLKFIEKIEYSPWVVSINNLDIRKIQKEEGEEKESRIDAFFQLRAYNKESN